MKKILVSIAAALCCAASVNSHASGDIEAGKAAVQKYNCASCHGADFNLKDTLYPKLAGQHEDYLAHALTAYRRGAQGPNGRGSPIMGAQVNRKDASGKTVPLSDREIQDIAAYLSSLPGSLVREK